MHHLFAAQLFCILFISKSNGNTGDPDTANLPNAGTFCIRIGLEKELNFIKQQLTSESKLRIVLEKDLSELKTKLSDEMKNMKGRNDEVEKQIVELKEENSQLNTQLRLLSDEMNNTIDRNDKLEKQIMKLTDDNSQLKTQLRLLSDEMNDTKEMNDELEKQIKELNDDNSRLNRSLHATVAKTERLKETVASMDNDDWIRYLTEVIAQYGNYTSERSVQNDFNVELINNLTTLDSQLRELNLSFHEQTEHQKMNTNVFRWIEEKFTNRDCQALLKGKRLLPDGVYDIYSTISLKPKPVFCDMNNGGWTVFQRRQDGSTNFYRTWYEYAEGFGDPRKEYWLGNKYLHLLTKGRSCILRIDFVNWDGLSRYAEYRDFRIEDEEDGFTLHIGSYSGNTGYDSLSYHNGMKFTTKDRDQDRWSRNCAVDYTGAWWYYACHNSNLNGVYSQRDLKGLRWDGYPLSDYMKYTAMKLKCD